MEIDAQRVDLAQRLGQIPTTIACDILKNEGLRDRVATGLEPMTAPAVSIAGPVRLIEFLPGRPELRRSGPPANFAMIDSVKPGEVLLLCAGGSLNGAVLGDMLCDPGKEEGCAWRACRRRSARSGRA